MQALNAPPSAVRYIQALLPPPLRDRVVRAEWRFVPSAPLGGDAFGYRWLDENHFAVFLLDVSGHGVGSALLAASAANMLRAPSLVGADLRDPAKVLAAMNDTLSDGGSRGSAVFVVVRGL
jgi:phosphoserine phosphatase RsbU/P